MHQFTHLLAAVAIVIAGFIQHVTHPELIDPVWSRIVVVLLLVMTPFLVRMPGFMPYLELWGFIAVEAICLWLVHLSYLNDFNGFLTFFVYVLMVANGFFHHDHFWRNLHYGLLAVLMGTALLLSDASLSVRLDTALNFGVVWITSYAIILYLMKQERRLALALSRSSALNHKLHDSQLLMEKTQAVGRIGGWEINLAARPLNITWSREVYRILDVPEGTVPTQALRRQFYAEGDFEEIQGLAEHCLQTGEGFDLKKEVHTLRGERKVVRIVGQRQEENGKATRLFGLFQDITQEHEAEQALLQAKAEAEAAAQAKSVFLSTMSHEIRTPLNAVIGLSHYLLEESPRPDQVESLVTLQTAGETLLSLINDILDFSKIEAGKLEIEPVAFPLMPRLEAIRQTFALAARQKGLALELELDPALPSVVVADPNRLTQVLNNLMSNALKFTATGGVTLVLQVLDTLDRNGDLRYRLRFAVQDSGIGIPADKLQDIFESFSQGRSGTSREYGGTGLGLTITRQLLQLMGSEIRVESTEGQGSRFFFDLWVGAANPADLPALAPATVIAAAGHILLAEDNEVNVRVMARFLEKWGHEVTVAVDGEEAVALARTKVFDLILMDLQMPKMDGLEATRQIRTFNTGVPIIALTADATTEIRQTVLEAGMNDFSPKPFVPAVLRAQIGVALRQRALSP